MIAFRARELRPDPGIDPILTDVARPTAHERREGQVPPMAKEKEEKPKGVKTSKPSEGKPAKPAKVKKEKAPAEVAAAPAEPKPAKAPEAPRPPADPRLKVLKKFRGKFLPKGPLRDRLNAIVARWNGSEDHGGVTVEELKALFSDWKAVREKKTAKAAKA
jgi:hypothetical protein